MLKITHETWANICFPPTWVYFAGWFTHFEYIYIDSTWWQWFIYAVSIEFHWMFCSTAHVYDRHRPRVVYVPLLFKAMLSEYIYTVGGAFDANLHFTLCQIVPTVPFNNMRWNRYIHPAEPPTSNVELTSLWAVKIQSTLEKDFTRRLEKKIEARNLWSCALICLFDHHHPLHCAGKPKPKVSLYIPSTSTFDLYFCIASVFVRSDSANWKWV